MFLLAQIEEKEVTLNVQNQEGQDGTKSCSMSPNGGSSTPNEQYKGEIHGGIEEGYSYNQAINLLQMDLFPGPHSDDYLAMRKKEMRRALDMRERRCSNTKNTNDEERLKGETTYNGSLSDVTEGHGGTKNDDNSDAITIHSSSAVDLLINDNGQSSETNGSTNAIGEKYNGTNPLPKENNPMIFDLYAGNHQNVSISMLMGK